MIWLEYNQYNEQWIIHTPNNDWVTLDVPAPGKAKNVQTQITQVSPTEILVIYEARDGQVCKKSCRWENGGYKEFTF